MKHDQSTSNADEEITCISCLTQLKRSESFCHECGAPVGVTATLDPLQAIRAEGFLFRRALEGRPKLIVLVGIWLLYLPVLVISAIAAVYIIGHMRGFSGFLFFWVMIGLSCSAFVILYRITKNYITIPKKR